MYDKRTLSKLYFDLRDITRKLGYDAKAKKTLDPQSELKLRNTMKELILQISGLLGIPCSEKNIKFQPEKVIKSSGNNASSFAIADYYRDCVIFSTDGVYNLINRIIDSNSFPYNSDGLALYMIDSFCHELKHRGQHLFIKKSLGSSNYDFSSIEWLNAMYNVQNTLTFYKIIPDIRKLAYIDDDIEADAYRSGIFGLEKVLHEIGRDDDINIDDTFFKRNLAFQLFAASYGSIPFHTSNGIVFTNIASYLHDSLQMAPFETRKILIERNPILSIQYHKNGSLKTPLELANQYLEKSMEIAGKQTALSDLDLNTLAFAYCFTFVNKLSEDDLKKIYAKWGITETNKMLDHISRTASTWNDYYNACFKACNDVKKNPNFMPKNFHIEDQAAYLEPKHTAASNYMNFVINRLSKIKTNNHIGSGDSSR